MQSYQGISKAFHSAQLRMFAACSAVILLSATTSLAQSGSRDSMLSLPGDTTISSQSAGGATNSVVTNSDVTPIYNGSSDVTYASGPVYSGGEGGTYSAGGSTYSGYLGAHMRARYNTRSYGQTRGNLDLGTAKFYDDGDGVWFADGQVTLNDDSGMGYNVGVGYRFLTLPLLPGSFDKQKIAGISLWSDGNATINDHFFTQVGVSMEFLGENWDVRSNISVPLEDTKIGTFSESGDITFVDNFLARETVAGVDEALGVAEVELARRVLDLDAWAFADVYALYGENTDTVGAKVGMRGYVLPDLSLSMAIAEDDVFGTNAVFNMTWFIGRTRGNVSNCSWAYQRLREPVIRNDYVAIAQRTTTSGTPITGDVNGDGTSERIRITHVDSSAADGGDGSFDAPLNALDDVFDNSTGNSIVLVHGGSSFDQDTAALRDGQRLLGEGGGIDHMVATDEFGTISIPETAPGAMAGAIPSITNTMGDVITLRTRTAEVSNLSIDGGDRAIVSPTGTTGVNLNNLAIANTTGNGIELTPASVLTNPADNDSQQVQFSPSISNVTFTDVGGDDINLDATSPEPANVPVVENIVIADVTSTGGQGTGINITGNSNAVTITDYSHDGGNSSTGGVLVTNAAGAISMTDATIMNEGGFGVRFVNNTNDMTNPHVLNDVTIQDTAGTAFDVDGGTGDIIFTGSITQGLDATTVAVSNGHTGELDFFESVPNAGVINTTNGNGLQFDNADGDYTFVDGVTLNGGDAGIDMLNGTDGTFDFAEATITSPTGIALNVESGASSLDYTGSITQSNDFSTIAVDGEHTGTFNFSEITDGAGIINATNGDGLQFSDADGAYLFNDAVVLDGSANGADTAIDIRNDSAGTFTFADATITNPTDIAVDVIGGTSTLTYTGEITQGNDFATLSVTGEHNGTHTYIARDTTSDVITATHGVGLVYDNADGTYSVLGGMTLDGSANGADTGIDIINDSAGIFNFANATITDPTGTGLNIEGGSANVTFTGTITQMNNFTAVSVTDGHSGRLEVNEATAGAGAINVTNGNGLQFNEADGTYNFNHAVVLNGGDAGIDILNNSAGTFTFAEARITDPTGVGFNVVGGSSDVTLTGEISQSNASDAVSITGGHTGTITFNEIDAGDGAVIATNGDGIQFDNADGSYFFNDGVTLNGGNAGIDIANDSSGSMFFDSGSSITNPTGDAFVSTGGSANVTYLGTITDNTGHAVRVTSNTGGGASFGGLVTSSDEGILVQNNTGGNYAFSGGADLDTGANDAVTLDTNSGTTISFQNLDINTTTGNGFVSNDTEGLTATGTGSSITATTGTGLTLNNTTIGAAGFTLDSVSVDGATNGIVMDNVTGGAVNIGAGVTAGDGGVIQNTTGAGVSLTNVANVSLNFMQVTGSTGDGIDIRHSNTNASNVTIADSDITGSTGDGINYLADGAGATRLTLNRNGLNGNGAESIDLTIDDNATLANISIAGNMVVNSSNSEALIVNTAGNSQKTVNLLLDDNDFTNNDPAAAGVDLQANGDVDFNITALSNVFNNTDAATGRPFEISSNDGQANVRLRMSENTALASNGGDDYFLIENAGTFSVQNLLLPVGDTIEDDNTGEFDFSPNIGAFDEDAGSIPTP